MKVSLNRLLLTAIFIVSILSVFVMPLPAQTKPNFIHRHPTATAIAAGAGTTILLKRSAKYKREHGERLNLAEKHPYLSGMGVAVVTHHVLKKHKQE
jgi:hypothetical protein